MIPVYLPELDPANQERSYTRVTYGGSSCIMEPHEADALIRENPGMYTFAEVRMTRSQFEKLPDFAGW